MSDFFRTRMKLGNSKVTVDVEYDLDVDFKEGESITLESIVICDIELSKTEECLGLQEGNPLWKSGRTHRVSIFQMVDERFIAEMARRIALESEKKRWNKIMAVTA